MTAEVRCTQCHRVEDWSAAGDGGWCRVERSPGGARRPAAPERQALEAYLLDGERVVAACPACGQPMVGDGPPPIPWKFAVPGGALVLTPDHRATGPRGPLTADEAAAAIRAAYPEPAPSRWLVGFQVALLVLMLAPIAVWLFSVLFVTFFLSHAGDAL